MGSSGGKGGGTDYAAQNYQAGYANAQSGNAQYDYSNHSEADAWNAGMDAYYAEQTQQDMFTSFMEGFEAPEMPEPPEPPDPMTLAGSGYETIKESLGDLEEGQMYGYTEGNWQTMNIAEAPEDLKYGFSGQGNTYAEGIGARKEGYGDYTTLFGQATDFVNTQIGSEQDNAALLGIDYSISDEQKIQRINDQFAGMWDTTDQERLSGLFKEWGDPEGFTGWLHQTGDASKSTDTTTGTTASTTDTQTGANESTSILDPDDDEDLGSQSILGG